MAFDCGTRSSKESPEGRALGTRIQLRRRLRGSKTRRDETRRLNGPMMRVYDATCGSLALKKPAGCNVRRTIVRMENVGLHDGRVQRRLHGLSVKGLGRSRWGAEDRLRTRRHKSRRAPRTISHVDFHPYDGGGSHQRFIREAGVLSCVPVPCSRLSTFLLWPVGFHHRPRCICSGGGGGRKAMLTHPSSP
jgi:hypothetical protein